MIRRARVRERVPFGSNVIAGHLERDPQYGPFMATHLDSVTVGNNLQWVAVEPKRGERRFRGADRVVSFASANGLEVRGHPLVWWAGLPAWLLNGSWSREELIEIMRDRIHALVGRYRGQITAWDVVNEAIDADGSYRQSLWMDVIGPEYIDLAFRFAHEADPDARLFYNEYDAEVANPRSDAMLELVSGMLARDVPIDGVGFQTHLFGEHPDAAAIAANFERFAALGLELEVTEMDVPDYTEAPGSGERRALQADAYRIVASVCRREPACQRLTTWGLTDRYTWLGSETQPLPFDEALRPKPAWESLRAELRPPRK